VNAARALWHPLPMPLLLSLRIRILKRSMTRIGIECKGVAAAASRALYL
jgi:hypothetical protein